MELSRLITLAAWRVTLDYISIYRFAARNVRIGLYLTDDSGL